MERMWELDIKEKLEIMRLAVESTKLSTISLGDTGEQAVKNYHAMIEAIQKTTLPLVPTLTAQ